jgi:hypothetical protein
MAKINTDAGVARDGSGGAVAVVARSDAGVFWELQRYSYKA